MHRRGGLGICALGMRWRQGMGEGLTRTDVKPSTIDRGLCILLGPWRAKHSPSPTARSIPLIPFLENAGFV